MIDFSTLEQTLYTCLRNSQIPGFSLAITDREKTLYTFTYTSETVSDPQITPDTLFEIGSVGKSFTSVLFQQLVDAGEYDLHLPVTHYLPWLEIPSPFEPITAHHLLSHSAGIIGGMDFSGETLSEVYALRESPATNPPGTHFRYSNVGYKVLGAILEHVTGHRYVDLVRERIIKPLGLTATYPAITHDLRPRMAVGYVPLYDDRPKAPAHPLVPATWLESATSDGCIASTPSDLAAYLRMYMNCGHEGVLSSAGYKRMVKPVIDMAPGLQYGYGLWTDETSEEQFIGHSGGMVGYVTQMFWHPETGYGYTCVSNAIGVPALGPLFGWIRKALIAVVNGSELPPLELKDPLDVESAGDYAGNYQSAERTIKIRAQDDEHLFLVYEDEELPLASYYTPDQFICPHPDFERFVLVFERNEEKQITSIAHGEILYVPEGHDQPQTDYPAEWDAYRGHYRSYSPWLTSFRVLVRGSKLYMVMGGTEERLERVGEHVFRIGEEHSPERLTFGWMVEQQAVQVRYNAAPYYRTFTP